MMFSTIVFYVILSILFVWGIYSYYKTFQGLKLKRMLFKKYPNGFAYNNYYYTPDGSKISEIPENIPEIDGADFIGSSDGIDSTLSNIDISDYQYIDAPCDSGGDGGG